ncbi:MAG: DUF1887 family protein [Bacteroidales bacterium]|jgi:hypothetical protein|nr:DUF1887 family protein [Bacteroidales bacterium]
MTTLISLLSEHLLPNFLLAKELAGQYDRHVFITTRQMGEQGMTARFCNALKIDKREVQIIVVSEDDLPDARAKLGKCNFSKDDRYIVNLTGGTKIMSIAAFQHFFKYDALYYYVPIGVNRIENVRTGENFPLNYRVNVEEYLSLYGLTFTAENANRIQDTKGAEFEAYITNRIKSEKGVKNGHIYRGVKVFRENEKANDNELDVMWTADNQIFVGECKVSLRKPKELDSENRPINKPPEYLNEIMYKLAAVSKEFGLHVNPYIFIKKEIFNAVWMKAIEKRKKILGIRGVIGSEELKKEKLPI